LTYKHTVKTTASKPLSAVVHVSRWGIAQSTLWASLPAYFKTKGSFDLSYEDAQNKNYWRLRIKGLGSQLTQD